ncbi:MAG: HDIG domain-containing protein [Desulfobacteraceae bacterium]|nr:MAG: HDIG domain-containing protein [Desulfobacteraceae bacterium]
MEIYEMPSHIRDHSIMVERIAALLAAGLQEAGAILSMEKVRAGALMHDIAKSLCFGSGEDHSAKGREICIRHGLDEIAEIVGEHVRIRNLLLKGPVTEKEIVYYADKRVNHDAVVSLDERLAYLIERYGKGLESLSRVIAENFQICRDVEKKIFSALHFKPGDLSEMVQKKGEEAK